MAEQSDVIQGSVLEVQDDAYTRAFGADRVTMSTVVDIDDANPRATLIADLSEPASLPDDAYDCIILTQTLHLIRRPERCVQNCYGGLRPGGTLLATAPSLSRVSPSHHRVPNRARRRRSPRNRARPRGPTLSTHRRRHRPQDMTRVRASLVPRAASRCWRALPVSGSTARSGTPACGPRLRADRRVGRRR